MKPLFRPISLRALAYFYRQLATMEDSGLTPAAAISTVQEQFSNAEFQGILGTILTGVEEGRSISEGMEKFPHVFTPFQSSLVRAGETGGTLSESYRRLADHLERAAQIRERLLLSLIYPVLILHVGVIILSFVTFLRSGLGPALLFGLLTLGPIYLVTLGITLVHRRLRMNEGWDLLIFRIPWVGPVRKKLCLVNFTRTLGALLEGGVNVTLALEQAGDACGSASIRREALRASELLEGGRGLAEAFVASLIFPPIILQMIDVGEKSGRIPETLSKTSEVLEDEATHAIAVLTKVLPLAIFLLIAGFLAFWIISFYAGIYGG